MMHRMMVWLAACVFACGLALAAEEGAEKPDPKARLLAGIDKQIKGAEGQVAKTEKELEKATDADAKKATEDLLALQKQIVEKLQAQKTAVTNDDKDATNASRTELNTLNAQVRPLGTKQRYLMEIQGFRAAQAKAEGNAEAQAAFDHAIKATQELIAIYDQLYAKELEANTAKFEAMQKARSGGAKEKAPREKKERAPKKTNKKEGGEAGGAAEPAVTF